MLSIIIPTVGRHQSLLRLLNSIANQDYPKESLEVLVVFNQEKPKRSLPTRLDDSLVIKTLIAPKKGVNNARNTGVNASSGDILIFIDDDCWLSDPLYLQNINHYHATYPDTLAIGGPYHLPEKANFWDRSYHKNLTCWLEGQDLPSPQSRFLLGGNASYKVSIFNQGLRFTPGITYGGSETPLNLNIYENHGPLYIFKNLSLQHQTRMSLLQYIKKAYKQGQGFAVQTKLMPQKIELPKSRRQKNIFYTFSYWLYDYYFVVGFRTSSQERSSILIPAIQELFSRFKKCFYGTTQNFNFVHRYIKALYANRTS